MRGGQSCSDSSAVPYHSLQTAGEAKASIQAAHPVNPPKATLQSRTVKKAAALATIRLGPLQNHAAPDIEVLAPSGHALKVFQRLPQKPQNNETPAGTAGLSRADSSSVHLTRCLMAYPNLQAGIHATAQGK